MYIKIKFRDTKMYGAVYRNRVSRVPHRTATQAQAYAKRWKQTAERLGVK